MASIILFFAVIFIYCLFKRRRKRTKKIEKHQEEKVKRKYVFVLQSTDILHFVFSLVLFEIIVVVKLIVVNYFIKKNTERSTAVFVTFYLSSILLLFSLSILAVFSCVFLFLSFANCWREQKQQHLQMEKWNWKCLRWITILM